ncbi:T9SS type A sorting domain-containing protein [Taibaiella koreensis]|uniref:T9SS type A sorting domain-containing protein n=1 Tax=Taibaiella koreensis TaxID=1268548 RepID=UPI0013C373C9|nr:T9SS type A sorting domain-containing protein [Taibaiella koreensis]
MKRCLCALLLLCLVTKSRGQQPAWTLKENSHWKFYQYGGLHFDNNNPEPDTSAMRFQYTSGATPVSTINAASVADADGNLLFYTDAYNVWDKEHHLMPAGTGLSGGNAMDAALIVPVIANPQQYYIFYMCGSIDFLGATTNAYELRYTLVDMSLNNGLGDVVAGQKNLLLEDNLSGAMKAVPGTDCNVWLITHDLYNTEFKVFEINNAGVNTTPVSSTVGNGAVGFMGPLSFGGNMAISHSGTKLAFGQNGGELVPIVELFDFNRSTAAITNPVVIDTLSFAFGMSLCFSPDNQKLYLSLLNPGGMSPANPNNQHVESSLFQYNTALGSGMAIKNSRVLLSDSISSYNNVMRLGPDGKIYLPASYGGDTSGVDGYFYPPASGPGSYFGAPFQAYLGCIQHPNIAGAGCSFNRKAVALPAYSSGTETMGGIFVKPAITDTVYARHDTMVCKPAGDAFVLQGPAGAYHFLWDDGSTGDQRTVSASGTYYVRNGNYCHYRVDTFAVVIGNPEAVIMRTDNTLSTTQPFDTYQWYRNANEVPGATNSTYTITQGGQYQVAVAKGRCNDTSGIFDAAWSGIEDLNAKARLVSIFPNPAKNIVHIRAPFAIKVMIAGIDGRIISKEDDAKDISLRGMDNGIYFLRLSDKEGRLLKVEKLVKAD